MDPAPQREDLPPRCHHVCQSAAPDSLLLSELLQLSHAPQPEAGLQTQAPSTQQRGERCCEGMSIIHWIVCLACKIKRLCFFFFLSRPLLLHSSHPINSGPLASLLSPLKPLYMRMSVCVCVCVSVPVPAGFPSTLVTAALPCCLSCC